MISWLARLFFSFRGRITRSEFLIVIATVYALSITSALIFVPEFLLSDGKPKTNGPDTIVQVALTYPSAAAMVKRYADFDWPAWPPLVVSLLTAATFIGDYYGVIPVGGSTVLVMTLAAIGVVMLAALIGACILPGTLGENRYGPAPANRVNPRPS
jgi:uncharacterized membrane protein YhaH (DUF805 family)